MRKWTFIITAYIIVGLLVYILGGMGFSPPSCCNEPTGTKNDGETNLVHREKWDDLLECKMVHKPQSLDKPKVKSPVIDPVFGVNLLRVTDASLSDIGGYLFEDPAVPLINSDNKYALSRTRTGSWVILDLQSKEIFAGPENLSLSSPRWHPTQGNLLIYFSENRLYCYNVSSDKHTLLEVFAGYHKVSGTYGGNLSLDGNKLLILGYDEKNTPLEIFVYDFKKQKQGTSMTLSPPEEFTSATITPAGDYVVISWAKAGKGKKEGTELYTPELDLVKKLSNAVGNGEVAYDRDGSQVYVMIDKEMPENLETRQVIKYSIPDGRATPVQTIEKCLKPIFSGRAYQRKGWIMVTTYKECCKLKKDEPCKVSDNWHQYENEIYALKLDGSGTTKRIIHHRHIKGRENDWAVSSTNSDMSIIVWTSNWGEITSEAADIYMVDLTGGKVLPE